MTDTRTAEVRLGQAINLAMQFAFLDGSKDMATAIETATEVLPEVLEFINKTQLKLAFDIQQTTPLQLPGPVPVVTQFADAPPAQLRQVPPPPGGPAQVPGAQVSKTDQLWQEYFANPSKFWDNRGNKKNPAGPDLKHKDTGEGLWLGGQWSAPQWVLDRMPF